jgi:hypothetical protein
VALPFPFIFPLCGELFTFTAARFLRKAALKSGHIVISTGSEKSFLAKFLVVRRSSKWHQQNIL